MKTTILNYRVIVKPDVYAGSNKSCFTAYSPSLGIADGGDTAKVAIKRITGAIESYVESVDGRKRYDKFPVIVPKGNRILTKGTLLTILKQADISLDEFLKIL